MMAGWTFFIICLALDAIGAITVLVNPDRKVQRELNHGLAGIIMLEMIIGYVLYLVGILV